MLPHVRRCDEERAFPWAVHERAAAEGMLEVALPESVGGGGLGVRDFVAGVEELAAVCGSITWTLVLNHGTLQPLLLAGTPDQQDLFVTQLVRRKGYASLCLTEPDSGSNLLAMKTRAINTDRGWLLNGAKCMVGNGTVAATFLVPPTTIVARRRRG